MFVQIIRGKAKDAGAMRAAMERWQSDLKPGATGYLGSTGGVAADGTFVTLARFESPEAAKSNSDRPEQGAWWEQTSKNLTDVTFEETTDVEVSGGGGSDKAGFVQVMFGQATDEAKVRSANQQFETFMKERPDLIGGLTCWLGGGRYVDVAYFVSEAEAREGERKELSAEAKAVFEDLMSAVGEIEFLDLNEPWINSP